MRAVLLVVAALAIGHVHAFAPLAGAGIKPALSLRGSARKSCTTTCMAVKDVNSEEELDKEISSAGDGTLVVIDYSTTWCGPCKVVAPKYAELSDKYSDAVFLKCVGDASPEATKLMKREGIRSVPAFHFWKQGAKVEVIAGANVEALENTIKENL